VAPNEAGEGDRDIATGASSARILVIEAREDLEMAANVRSVLGATP
jgi:hypothetical protein